MSARIRGKKKKSLEEGRVVKNERIPLNEQFPCKKNKERFQGDRTSDRFFVTTHFSFHILFRSDSVRTVAARTFNRCPKSHASFLTFDLFSVCFM